MDLGLRGKMSIFLPSPQSRASSSWLSTARLSHPVPMCLFFDRATRTPTPKLTSRFSLRRILRKLASGSWARFGFARCIARSSAAPGLRPPSGIMQQTLSAERSRALSDPGSHSHMHGEQDSRRDIELNRRRNRPAHAQPLPAFELAQGSLGFDILGRVAQIREAQHFRVNTPTNGFGQVNRRL
jgi:hypothetical protein